MEVCEPEKRYIALADSLPYPVFDLDSRGNFVFINKEASGLLGWRKELVGKKFAEKVPREHLYELLKLFRGAIRTGNDKARVNLEAGEQGYRQINLEVRAVKAGGKIAGFQCLVQRIPGERANMLALIYDMASTLIIAKGALELAIQGNAKNRRFLEIGRNALKRQNHIIKNLLDTFKFEELESELALREVDLGKILIAGAREFEPLAARKDVSIKLTIKEIPMVKAGPEKIRNAVYTLMGSAIKVCKSGGKIRITARRINDDVEVCFGNGLEGFSWNMCLDIVRRIIEAHDGRISVEEGKGFCFFLPAVTE